MLDRVWDMGKRELRELYLPCSRSPGQGTHVHFTFRAEGDIEDLKKELFPSARVLGVEACNTNRGSGWLTLLCMGNRGEGKSGKREKKKGTHHIYNSLC